jgi:hypothetical protein
LPAVTFNQFGLFGISALLVISPFSVSSVPPRFKAFVLFANRHSQAYNSPEMSRFFHGFT